MLSLKTECINIADLALKIYNKKSICERFEPRSHFKSMLSLIVLLNRTVVVDSDWRYCLVNYVAMLLVVCQLSRDVFGYEDS